MLGRRRVELADSVGRGHVGLDTSASLALLVETPANGLAFLSLIVEVAAKALECRISGAVGDGSFVHDEAAERPDDRP